MTFFEYHAPDGSFLVTIIRDYGYIGNLETGAFYTPYVKLNNKSDFPVTIRVKLVLDGTVYDGWFSDTIDVGKENYFWLPKEDADKYLTIGTHKLEWLINDETMASYEIAVYDQDPKSVSENSSQINVGDYITFGSYEQDNDLSNGKEDIEWLVLDKDGDSIFVISRYALDSQPFDKNWKDIWETCSLREWLNSTFINTAFNQSEQSKIQSTTIKSESGGNATIDKVFLLSRSEAEKYFNSKEARQRQGTAYCYAQGAYKYNNGNCRWWLRSSSIMFTYAGCVPGGGWFGLRQCGGFRCWGESRYVDQSGFLNLLI